MITDSMIKSEFIHSVLSESAAEIADTQAARLSLHKNKQSKSIAAELAGHPFDINVSGLSATLTFNLHMRLRFIDIAITRNKETGSLPVYNKIVWGTLYRQAYGTLRYGFTEDIRQAIGNKLREAVM